MCFGGGGPSPAPAPPPPPPAPPPPPPAPVPLPPPAPPPQQTAPQQTSLESSRMRAGSADVEARRRQREGTSRLKKKVPPKKAALRADAQPSAQGPAAPGGGGVNYGGQVSGSGMSLNIQKPK